MKGIYERHCKVLENKVGVKKLRELEKVGSNVLILCKCPLCGQEFTMWRSHFYRGSNGCKCSLPYSERLYSIWVNMKTRCHNPNIPKAKNYLNRGIFVGQEWSDSYKAFETWALSHSYTENLTIDRINNNDGYYPENCRWATLIEQGCNKRNNVFITINGEKCTLSEWSRKIKVSYKLLADYKYRYGLSATTQYIQKKIGNV